MGLCGFTLPIVTPGRSQVGASRRRQCPLGESRLAVSSEVKRQGQQIEKMLKSMERVDRCCPVADRGELEPARWS